MKKLNLEAFGLGATEVLTREQMKTVLGGSLHPGGNCSFKVCESDSDCGDQCGCSAGATAKFCQDEKD